MSRRKKRFSAPKMFIVVIVVILVATALAINTNYKSTLQFGNKTIAVEEVKSLRDKQKGLSGRESIADNRGMLFIYDEAGKHCFWMKDMKFPIDILWLDESKQVVYIAAHVPPESFPDFFCPPEDAKYVLEVKAGLSDQAGVDVGSQL